MNYEIVNLKNKKEIIDTAATWFSSKWNIPKEEYLNSINASINSNAPYPSWYIVLSNNKIIGGIGVIQNDFHEKKICILMFVHYLLNLNIETTESPENF